MNETLVAANPAEEEKTFKPYYYRHKRTGNIYRSYFEQGIPTEQFLFKTEDGTWKDYVTYNAMTVYLNADDPNDILIKAKYEKTFARTLEDFLEKFEPMTQEEHDNLHRKDYY